MNFDKVNKNFITTFNDLFQFLQIDHVFMSEIPESSLNSTEDMNVLVSITGNVEGNIMFCHSKGVAEAICNVMMGSGKIENIDFYVKTTLADFYNEFARRFVLLQKMDNMNEDKIENSDYTILTSFPTYVAGKNLYGVISKIPSKKLFFKVKGERFCIAYSLA